MKKLSALNAAILFSLGGGYNQAQDKQYNSLQNDVSIEANMQELCSSQKADAYLQELKDELGSISKLNNNKNLSPQNIFFLWYYTQKITELEMLLVKSNGTFSVPMLQKLHFAIQTKIDEIELLKGQAHHNFNNTNIIGL